MFLLVATLNNPERNVCVNALCKAVAEFGTGFVPEKHFSPNLELFSQNCFPDFFSEFHLLLESAYLGLGIRSRFPGDGSFLSG